MKGMLCALVFLVLGQAAWADEPDASVEAGEELPESSPSKTVWTAYVLRSKAPIEGLKILDSHLPVLLVGNGGKLRPLVQVRGSFALPGWKLFTAPKSPVRLEPDATFTISAYLNGNTNEMMLIAKGPNGDTKTEKVYIYTPDSREVETPSVWDHVVISLGGSNLRYRQSNAGPYSSGNGWLGLQYTSADWRRFGILAKGDATFVTVVSSPIQRSPQLIEVKLDGTCVLGSIGRTRWQFVAGVNYLTLLANDSPFGFSNLFGPDVGFRWRRSVNARTAWIGEFHYIPFDKNVMKERGWGLDLTWSKRLRSLHRLELGAVYSNYAFTSDNSTRVDTSLITLRIGYSI